jgi:hypothetical protein
MNPRHLAVGLLPLLALSSAPLAYQERLVLAEPAGACTLRLEADDGARTLRLRVSPEGPPCRVDRETVMAFLGKAVARAKPRPGGAYTSLYVGRLVDLPWLSEHVASAAARDAGWDRRQGRPVRGDANGYVAAILSRPDVTAPFDAAIRGAGYRIRSASVEKVLVRDLREVTPEGDSGRRGKVPYDAMTWFRLEPVAAP